MLRFSEEDEEKCFPFLLFSFNKHSKSVFFTLRNIPFDTKISVYQEIQANTRSNNKNNKVLVNRKRPRTVSLGFNTCFDWQNKFTTRTKNDNFARESKEPHTISLDF